MSVRSFLIVTIIGAVGLLGACGGKPSAKDRKLQGKIDGKDWKYSVAAAAVDSGSNKLDLDVYSSGEEPCASRGGHGGWKVMTTVPAEEKRTKLELSLGGGGGQTVTFYKGGHNKIIAEGFIEVTSLGQETVKVDLVARQDSDNFVNGSFEAVRCDNQGNGS